MKFCFLCGKKTEKLSKGYCEECYNKKFQLIKVPEEIVVNVCSKCRKIKEKNSWKDIEIDKILRDKIKILGKNVRIRIEKNDIMKVHAKGFLEGSKVIKEEVHEVEIKFRKETCTDCSRKFGRYYESVVQVRGNLTDEDVNLIDDIVLSKNGFYRIEDVKGGYNFLLSSRALSRQIAELLKRRYKTEIKKSFELVTKQEGIDIYRNIILVRIISD